MSENLLSGTDNTPSADGTTQAASAAPEGTATATAATSAAPGVEGAAAAESGGTATTAAPAGAPETYADFTLPEGVTFDAALGGDLKDYAKAQNLSQEQAQGMVDLGAKLAQSIVTKQQEQHQKLVDTWATEAKADKEIGGDNMTASIADAKKAMTTFGGDKFTALLDETGLGNHPEVIRFLAKAGRAISNDTIVRGEATTARKDPADVLYGSKE